MELPVKQIPLIDRGTFKAREVIVQIVRTPGAGTPINFDEMNKRIRVIEAVEKADKAEGTVLSLEDADYQTLLAAMLVFPFGVADPDLFALLTAIKNA